MLSQPSVIARLMGMEEHMTIVPAPAAAAIREAEGTTINLLRARPSSSSGEASPAKAVAASKLKHFKCSSLPHHGRINLEYYRYCLSKMKPRRRSRRSSSRRDHHDRHHPQEELLEKIKEEFRASWQHASMSPPPSALEDDGNATVTSSGMGSSSADRAGWVDVDGRYIQRVAQENLRREKMARYGHGAKAKVEDEDGDIDTAVVALNEAEEAEQLQRGGAEAAESEAASSDRHRAEPEEFFRDSGAAVSGDHDHDQMSSASENSRGTPTRISILRPVGTTRAAAGDHGEPGFGTPPTSWKATRDGGGMEEFLRAVKERLDNEMKAKTGAGDLATPTTTTTTRRRQWGSAEPEQDTARRIREAVVTKEDLGRRLSRLESFRVFRADLGRRAAAAVKSPEHRMLKRVRARIEAMSPKKTRLSGPSSPVSSRGGRAWSSPPADFGPASSLSGVVSDEEVDEGEGMSCCTGDRRRLMTRLWKVHGAASTADTHVAVSPTPSPRALVRSLSAPASWRVSDLSCGEGAEATLRRSRSFSLLRGTVASGLKQSFRLLLLHLTKKSSPSSPQDSGSLITASQADFLAGLAPPSPVSPLEVHGRSPRHFSGCTFLPESSPRRSPRCSSEFGASAGGGAESPWRWKTGAGAESYDEDPDKAYVRELLIATGLFDDDDEGDGGGESSEDTVVARTDTTAGPIVISEGVFYEVEDAYYYRRLRRRVDEGGAGEEEERWTDRRRLLFDLANEALQALQAVPSSSSLSLCRWVVGSGDGVSSFSRLPSRGSKLEEEVWQRVARAMTEDDDAPAPATTVDGMMEREVRKSPWMDALREDVCDVGRKVERAIFDELVSEVLRQVFVRT